MHLRYKVFRFNTMTISDNIQDIHTRMTKVAAEFNTPLPAAKLIAVSKFQTMNAIQEALDAGHRCFGENRVQEAQEHWLELRLHYPDLELHLIGALQTNKAADAVALFDIIQSLDREKLARALASEMKKQGRNVPCLVQVNTGAEAQKAGIAPQKLGGFLEFCRNECGLVVNGLMCIPPPDDPPALHFALLRNLARQFNLTELSMGMSGDFEKAIPLGATYVRVGTAIFGERG